MTTRGATLAALLAVIGRPGWWVLGLAGFLARGGILLFLLAVVVLPSPLAISDLVAPLLVPLVFGGVTPVVAAIIALGIGSVVAWILVGGLIGASTEVVLIADARAAAPDEGVPIRVERRPASWAIVRVAVARLVAHVPFAISLALGSVQVVNVAYVQLTTPSEIATPLPLRIVLGSLGPLLVMAAALVLGEVTGGLAARRIALGGGSVLGSVSHAYRDLLTRPRSAALPALLTTAILALDLAAVLAIVDLGWAAARSQLVQLPANPLGIGLSIVSFAAAWALALLVTGLIDTWRSVAMTFEEERFAAAAEAHAGAAATAVAGTFGASGSHRPGDYPA